MQKLLFAIALVIVSLTGAAAQGIEFKLKVGMKGNIYPLISLNEVVDRVIKEGGEPCGNYFIERVIPEKENTPRMEILTFFILEHLEGNRYQPIDVNLESRFVVPYKLKPQEGEPRALPIYEVKSLEAYGPVEMIAITLSAEELERSPCLK